MATCIKLSRFATSLNIQTFFRRISQTTKGNQQHCFAYTIRQKSSSSSESNPSIALSKDGSTFLCWHPPKKFPYECTKPLPRSEEVLREGDSALKVQYRLDHQMRRRPEGPTSRELSEMFRTYRWEFRPRPGKYKFRKPNPPRDREGM